MIKLSIIVPVYNVEYYLEECLNSIINQTIKEIEIICVDDCSNDNSYSILKKYAKEDNRIKLLKHDLNRGLGPARNTGIIAAVGEYIGFIDSDDYISKDYFENLYITAKKYDSDLVSTLNILTDTDSNIEKYSCNIDVYVGKKEKNYIEGKSEISIINEKERSKEYAFVVAWNKIYKRSFLINNSLYFMDIKFGIEDEDFYQRILAKSPSSSYNHKSIYYYRQRSQSLINSYDKNILSMRNNILLMNNSIEYYKENNPDLLSYLYLRVCEVILLKFDRNYYKSENYVYMFDFLKELSLNSDFINKAENCYFYNDYLSIISNNTYESYLYMKTLFIKISNLENKLDRALNNQFKIFSISKNNNFIVLTFFGIRISIKRRLKDNKK